MTSVVGLVAAFWLCTSSATDLNGLNLDGENTNLQSLVADGQWNIVMVWASYCSACKKDFPKVNKFIKSHRDDPIHVVGVSVDGPEKLESVQRISNKYGLKFDTVVSEFNDFGGFYVFETDRNFAGTPTYMVYNPSGMLVAHGAGPMDFDGLSAFIENQLR